MKNAKGILLLTCALSLTLMIGIFLGRNLTTQYAKLPTNSISYDVIDEMEMHDYRLDINTATWHQLIELPGIGEVMAQRIIDYRTQNGLFTTKEELLDVMGIGEKKLLQIEPYIKVGG